MFKTFLFNFLSLLFMYYRGLIFKFLKQVEPLGLGLERDWL